MRSGDSFLYALEKQRGREEDIYQEFMVSSAWEPVLQSKLRLLCTCEFKTSVVSIESSDKQTPGLSSENL